MEMDSDSVGDELEALTTLVELYEDEHFPIDELDPLDLIKFRAEQMVE